MIKNDSQLSETFHQLRKLEAFAESYRDEHIDKSYDSMLGSIDRQIEDIRKEIETYRDLKQLTFEQAVAGPLGKGAHIEQLSDLLAKLRVAADLTQADLAERLGWHQANVSRFESENYSSHTLIKIIEYTSALDVWLYLIPSFSPDQEFLSKDVTEKLNLEVEYSTSNISSELMSDDREITSEYISFGSFWANIRHTETVDECYEKIFA